MRDFADRAMPRDSSSETQGLICGGARLIINCHNNGDGEGNLRLRFYKERKLVPAETPHRRESVRESVLFMEEGGEAAVEIVETPERALLFALNLAELICEMEAGEDGDARRIGAGGAGGDAVHQGIHRLGESLGFGRVAGGAQRVGLLEDGHAHHLLFGA